MGRVVSAGIGCSVRVDAGAGLLQWDQLATFQEGAQAVDLFAHHLQHGCGHSDGLIARLAHGINAAQSARNGEMRIRVGG